MIIEYQKYLHIVPVRLFIISNRQNTHKSLPKLKLIDPIGLQLTSEYLVYDMCANWESGPLLRHFKGIWYTRHMTTIDRIIYA